MFAQNGNQTIDPNQTNNNACNTVTVSLSEVNKALAAMLVYPNPATDLLTISLDYAKAKQVNILDISGKLVATQAITSTVTQINVSALTTGVYLYQILDDEGAVVTNGKFSVTN
jgi:hypothetical protein